MMGFDRIKKLFKPENFLGQDLEFKNPSKWIKPFLHEGHNNFNIINGLDYSSMMIKISGVSFISDSGKEFVQLTVKPLGCWFWLEVLVPIDIALNNIIED